MNLATRREIARLVASEPQDATDAELGEALSHLVTIEVAGQLDIEDEICRDRLVEERLARA